jgi:phosphatidate cytidylyltransferase
MSKPGRWSDLGPRVASAIVMVVVGAAAVVVGGNAFHLFIAAICGAMLWELARMIAPDNRRLALLLGGVSAATIALALHLPAAVAWPLLLLPALAGGAVLREFRWVFGLYGAMIALAGYELLLLRADFGVIWLSWLVLVVIASDVAGYFAGKTFGGARFWPRVSPNKTWSGTIAGWLAAAAVGLGFALWQRAGLELAAFSVLVALAAQIGDIAESAIKRKTGVKDSSALIPGHGGVLDRFDGMLGAALLLLAGMIAGLPFGAG